MMGRSFDSAGRLVCDVCGGSGGVSRRKCPSGYCPSLDAHAACLSKVKAAGEWKRMHAGCAAAHADFMAREAAKAAAPAKYVKAAWGSWAGWVPDGMVGLVSHADVWMLVPAADYAARKDGLIPASAVALAEKPDVYSMKGA